MRIKLDIYDFISYNIVLTILQTLPV